MNKAILIDAENSRVTMVTLPNGYKEWHKVMKCDIATVAFYIDDHDSVLVDDEGMLKQPERFFLYEGFHHPLAGNGLVVGCDEEGNTEDCNATEEAVRAKVKFMNKTELMIYLYANQ